MNFLHFSHFSFIVCTERKIPSIQSILSIFQTEIRYAQRTRVVNGPTIQTRTLKLTFESGMNSKSDLKLKSGRKKPQKLNEDYKQNCLGYLKLDYIGLASMLLDPAVPDILLQTKRRGPSNHNFYWKL